MSKFQVAKRSDIPEGQARVYWAGEKRLAIAHVEGQFFAIDDLCTHDGGPLGEGVVCGFEIECPRHGALFDVRTGEALTMPAVSGVDAYSVELSGDDLYVEVPED